MVDGEHASLVAACVTTNVYRVSRDIVGLRSFFLVKSEHDFFMNSVEHVEGKTSMGAGEETRFKAN